MKGLYVSNTYKGKVNINDEAKLLKYITKILR